MRLVRRSRVDGRQSAEAIDALDDAATIETELIRRKTRPGAPA